MATASRRRRQRHSRFRLRVSRLPLPRRHTSAPRTAGVTPRGAGASGAYSRVDRISDYSYVTADLRRLGITAAAILAGLVVLGFFVR